MNKEWIISEKLRIVDILLCFFFGCLDIHRFHEGKIGTSILCLFYSRLVQYRLACRFYLGLVCKEQGQEWITDHKMVKTLRDQAPVHDTNTCYSADNLGQRTRNTLLEMACSM